MTNKNVTISFFLLWKIISIIIVDIFASELEVTHLEAFLSKKYFIFVSFLLHIFFMIIISYNYSIIILGFCFKGAWIFVTCSLSLLLICVTKSQWRQAKTGFFVCFTLTWVINLLRITALKSQNSHWCLNIFKWTASMCSFNFPLNW